MSTFSVETRRKIKAKSFGFCYNCRQLHPRMEHHHLLANTKLNEKLYGREVIQSVENGVYVCSLVTLNTPYGTNLLSEN